MIVRMLTQECGPAGSFGIGELRTVSEEHGYMLVDTKHAELVESRKIEVTQIQECEKRFVEVPEVVAPDAPQPHRSKRK